MVESTPRLVMCQDYYCIRIGKVENQLLLDPQKSLMRSCLEMETGSRRLIQLLSVLHRHKKRDFVLESFLNYGLRTLPRLLLREDKMSPHENRRKISWERGERYAKQGRSFHDKSSTARYNNGNSGWPPPHSPTVP